MPRLVAPRHLAPVDHVPERVYVLQASVAVLEVVGVLPRVQPQDRDLLLHQRRVLVRRRLYRERAVGLDDQPRPPRAKQGDRGRGGGELLLEAVERAEAPGDVEEVFSELRSKGVLGSRTATAAQER